MSQQTELDLSTIYNTVLDFTQTPADRIMQGRTRRLRIEFGESPLEPTDKFSLPLRESWEGEPYRTLYGKFFAVVEEDGQKYLEIAFMGDETSRWPLAGAGPYHLRVLEGVLNHHEQDGAEREHSGNVLVRVAFQHTLDRT